MTPATDVTAVILCGGAGRRMGRGQTIKPLLTHADGLTLLARIEQVLAPLVAEVVVAATAQTADRLAEHTSARISIDPGAGPAVALRVAAKGIRTEWLLLAGGDHAHIDAALVEHLACYATPNTNVVMAAGQPLFALYRTAAIIADSGAHRSLRRFAAALGATVIEVPAALATCWDDVDTVEDAQRLGVSIPLADGGGAGTVRPAAEPLEKRPGGVVPRNE